MRNLARGRAGDGSDPRVSGNPAGGARASRLILGLLLLLVAAPAWAQSINADGGLNVHVINGGTGGTAATDNSAFTGGTTAVTPMGALYDLTPPAITDGNVGVPVMDSSRRLIINCGAGCAAASDTVGSSVALNAGNAAASVALTGDQGVGMFLAAGTLAATITPELSFDGGTNWIATKFYNPTDQSTSATLVVTNPSAATTLTVLASGGASHARVRVSAYTSGTATATLRATATTTASTGSGGGGGTQYAEDTVSSAGDLLTMAGVVRKDTAATLVDTDGDRTQLQVDATGRLWVNGSGVTQPVSAATLPLPTGAATEATLAGIKTGTDKIPASPSTDRTTAGGPFSTRLSDGAAFYDATKTGQLPAALTGSGNLKTALVETTVTQPVSGTVTANAGTNLNTSALALEATLGRAIESTTSGQTGPLVQGAVTTAAPTYTTGRTDPLSLTTTGLLRVDGSGVTQPVSGTFWQATQPVSGPLTDAQLRASPVPVSGTVTTTPPANASTNVAQFGGSNVVTGTGAGGAGIPRVTISSDSSLAANQSVNQAQVSGTAVSVNNGTVDAGTQRVTIASNSTGQVTLATGANVIGSLAANQSENVAQFGGAAVVTGTGTGGAGIPRVTVSSDSTVTANAGTGTFTVAGTKTNNSAVPGATNVGTLPGVATAAAPTYVEGNQVALSTDLSGAVRISGGATGSTFYAAMPTTGSASGFRGDNATMVPGTVDQWGQLRAVIPQTLMASIPPNPLLRASGVVVTPGSPSTGNVGSPAPKQATYEGGVGSGRALIGFVRCDQSVAISTAASGFTQLVPLIAGQSIYVCGYSAISTTAVSVKFSYGTGSACGTGTVDLTGAMAVAANGGLVEPNTPIPLFELPAGQALCINLSGAVQTSGRLKYAQF